MKPVTAVGRVVVSVYTPRIKGCLLAIKIIKYKPRYCLCLCLLIRAAVVAWPSTPNTIPHISDWYAAKPRGTGMEAWPFMLRPGMVMNPSVHMVGVGAE